METSMVKKTTLGVDKKSPASKTKSSVSKIKSKDQLTEYVDVAQQEAMIANRPFHGRLASGRGGHIRTGLLKPNGWDIHFALIYRGYKFATRKSK